MQILDFVSLISSPTKLLGQIQEFNGSLALVWLISDYQWGWNEGDYEDIPTRSIFLASYEKELRNQRLMWILISSLIYWDSSEEG